MARARIVAENTNKLDTFSELISQRRLSGNFTAEDLALSAEVGQALLEEVNELKERLSTADTARDQLLDRLAASYRSHAVLERVRYTPIRITPHCV